MEQIPKFPIHAVLETMPMYTRTRQVSLHEAKEAGDVHYQGDFQVRVEGPKSIWQDRRVVLQWEADKARRGAWMTAFPDNEDTAICAFMGDLSNYCNAKFVSIDGKSAVRIIPNLAEDCHGVAPNIWLAADQGRGGREQLQHLWGALVEATRLVSPTAKRTQSWFDTGVEFDEPQPQISTDPVALLDLGLAGSLRMLRWMVAFLESLQGPGGYSSLSMLGYMQKSSKSIARIPSIDRNDRTGQKAHRMAKEMTGWLCRITRDIHTLQECPGEQHKMYGAQHAGFVMENAASIFTEMQVLLECQMRVLVEQALFSSVLELNMSERTVLPGAMLTWVRSMSSCRDKEISVNQRKEAFLEGESMPWIDKLQKKCPGQFETTNDVLELFYGLGSDDVLSLICQIKLCCSPVQKVRLWSDAILRAIKVIMDAMPEGTEPLGGPDLPQVALFLLCHCGDNIYAHARLAELFTLDFEGYDQQALSLNDGGLYADVHDQYTYNAERRSIYPQMMMQYLVEGCEIIAASEFTPRHTRSSVEGAWGRCSELEMAAPEDAITQLIHTAAKEAEDKERDMAQAAELREEELDQKKQLKKGLPFDVWGS